MSPVDRLASMPERSIVAALSHLAAAGFVLMAIGRRLNRNTHTP